MELQEAPVLGLCGSFTQMREDDTEDNGTREEGLVPELTWKELVFDHAWKLCPGYTKASHFLQEMFSLELVNPKLCVYKPGLYAQCTLEETARFVRERETSFEFIVIPVILQSMYINHIVVLILDIGRKHAVYYDPKAGNPLHEFKKPFMFCVEKGVPCSVLLLCNFVLKSIPGSLMYSTSNDQHWLHPLSCGAYCVRFVQKYIFFRDAVKHTLAVAWCG